jgi:hypothetical protein
MTGVHETENARLYVAAPPAAGEHVGVQLDADALRELASCDGAEPRFISVTVMDPEVDGEIARAFSVLEVAGRWYGPVDVVAGTGEGGRVAVPPDAMIRLRVHAPLHVPASVRDSVDVQ